MYVLSPFISVLLPFGLTLPTMHYMSTDLGAASSSHFPFWANCRLGLGFDLWPFDFRVSAYRGLVTDYGTLVLIAQATFLLECRQTDRCDWMPYPTPAAIQPTWGQHTGQPVIADKKWRILLEHTFYWPHVVADGNYCIQIMEKMLKFLNGVNLHQLYLVGWLRFNGAFNTIQVTSCL